MPAFKWSFIVVCAISILSGPGWAEVVEAPRFDPISLGVESHIFRWKAPRKAVGEYSTETEGVYTLTGNGHGVYWCWDAGGFANIPATFDTNFTFTARLRNWDGEDAPVHCGILVKASTDTRSPSLSLRWDTHWEQNGETGLTWFNRLLPTERGGLSQNHEKLCQSGDGQGCMGMGYENVVPGFDRKEDVWLRVKRIIEDGMSKYYLYAKYGSDEEFTEIPPVTSQVDPCGRGFTGRTFPHFMVPSTERDVLVGLFVSDGNWGRDYVSAEFDNITIEVPGELQYDPEPDLLVTNSFAPGKNWPFWYGPNSNFSAMDTEYELIEDLRNARKIWESEEMIPHCGKNVTDGTSTHYGGGGSSPIFAENKVFMYYYHPECATCDNADDVVIAMDARNGKTVWKKVFENAGKNVLLKKSGMKNLTPCYSDGYVFALGSAGRLYCLEAETGDLKWEKMVGVDTEGENALTYAEGAVITSHASLAAYDTTSGARLWSLPHSGGGTPVRWLHNGREYVIYGNTEGVIQCIEPRTGDIVWTVTDAGHNKYPLSISGDYLLANVGGRNRHTEAQLGCYHLTLDGAQRAWLLPKSYGGPFGTSMVISKGYAYIRVKNFLCVELETGNIVGELDKGQVNVAGSYAINDRIIFEADANHQAAVWYAMLDAEPGDFSVMGSDYWFPTHTYSSSYRQIATDAMVDGRVFIRGYYGPVCYDLRKTGETAVSRPEGLSQGPNSQKYESGSLLRSQDKRAGMTLFDIRGRRQNAGTSGMVSGRRTPGVYLILDERTGKRIVRHAPLGIE